MNKGIASTAKRCYLFHVLHILGPRLDGERCPDNQDERRTLHSGGTFIRFIVLRAADVLITGGDQYGGTWTNHTCRSDFSLNFVAITNSSLGATQDNGTFSHPPSSSANRFRNPGTWLKKLSTWRLVLVLTPYTLLVTCIVAALAAVLVLYAPVYRGTNLEHNRVGKLPGES